VRFEHSTNRCFKNSSFKKSGAISRKTNSTKKANNYKAKTTQVLRNLLSCLKHVLLVFDVIFYREGPDGHQSI